MAVLIQQTLHSVWRETLSPARELAFRDSIGQIMPLVSNGTVASRAMPCGVVALRNSSAAALDL
jgi:hypothetical protein